MNYFSSHDLDIVIFITHFRMNSKVDLKFTRKLPIIHLVNTRDVPGYPVCRLSGRISGVFGKKRISGSGRIPKFHYPARLSGKITCYPAGYPAIRPDIRPFCAKTGYPDPAGYQKLQKLSIRRIPVQAGYEKSLAGTSLIISIFLSPINSGK